MSDTDTTQDGRSGARSFMDELPLDRLKSEARNAAGALASKAASSASDRVGKATQRLGDYAENGANGDGEGLSPKLGAVKGGLDAKSEGKSPVMGGIKGGLSSVKDSVKNALGGGGGGKGGGGSKVKVTNIIETIDVGVPVSVAYNAWTEFQEWSGFMKKVEHSERQKQDEAKVDFKAQVFWSHRSWTGNIIEEVPDERIVWRSKGEKGTVDGAVTFHEIGPNLTRILVVLEYHPQGFFEKTGNIWRAQGRRARLELKHFRRHVMTRTILHPDDVEGWRGEIRDGEVVESHDDAVAREQEESEQEERDQDESQEAAEGEGSADEGDEYDDEYEEDVPEEEYEEDVPEDEYEDVPEEDDYEDEVPEEEEVPEEDDVVAEEDVPEDEDLDEVPEDEDGESERA